MDDEYSSSSAALLLELAASDDLPAFRRAVEQRGGAVDTPAPWYGPRTDGKGGGGGGGMGYEMRTPLQVAALYGSVGVMRYLLSRCGVGEVNRACGSDGATALHCAAAGGASAGSREVIMLLLGASADVEAVDAAGRRPADLVRRRIRMRQAGELEGLLLLHPAAAAVAGAVGDEKEEEDAASWWSSSSSSSSSLSLSTPASPPQRKEYPPDSTLPDIATGLYSTDEFRMYVYKVAPCPRAYSHDWTDCPFAHPGENARRRDPRRVPYYSPAPCPDFRRSAALSGAAAASCPRGDGCEFAHGVFESWLHPAQYRTRMCKDEGRCGRRVCFFAHSVEEMRQPAEEVMDLGVISAAMGLGGSQQQQQMKPVGVAGRNGVDIVYSQRTKLSPPHQQFLPSGYNNRATTARLHSASSSPCSPRTPRTPAASLGSSSSSIDPKNRSRGSPAASAFAANRSLSFSADRSCGRAAAQTRLYLPGISNLSGWGSADGKLDWGIQGDELSKLRKTPTSLASARGQQQQQMVVAEPDVSWVQSVVFDGPGGADDDVDVGGGLLRFNPSSLSSWPTAAVDAVYREPEQLVA